MEVPRIVNDYCRKLDSYNCNYVLHCILQKIPVNNTGIYCNCAECDVYWATKETEFGNLG